MRVRVTTDRGVWINGERRERGDVQTVTDEEAALLFQHGFAEPETPVTAADLQEAHQCADEPPVQDEETAPAVASGRRRRGV
jgi:hypothetical protein